MLHECSKRNLIILGPARLADDKLLTQSFEKQLEHWKKLDKVVEEVEMEKSKNSICVFNT